MFQRSDRAATSRVQVNLMNDAIGSLGTPASFFSWLKQKGIAAVEYRPLDPFDATLSWTLSPHSYCKMLIVDGRAAFTGSIKLMRGLRTWLVRSPKNPSLRRVGAIPIARSKDRQSRNSSISLSTYGIINRNNCCRFGIVFQRSLSRAIR
jgi:hypothetical protein